MTTQEYSQLLSYLGGLRDRWDRARVSADYEGRLVNIRAMIRNCLTQMSQRTASGISSSEAVLWRQNIDSEVSQITPYVITWSGPATPSSLDIGRQYVRERAIKDAAIGAVAGAILAGGGTALVSRQYWWVGFLIGAGFCGYLGYRAGSGSF